MVLSFSGIALYVSSNAFTVAILLGLGTWGLASPGSTGRGNPGVFITMGSWDLHMRALNTPPAVKASDLWQKDTSFDAWASVTVAKI